MYKVIDTQTPSGILRRVVHGQYRMTKADTLVKDCMLDYAEAVLFASTKQEEGDKWDYKRCTKIIK